MSISTMEVSDLSGETTEMFTRNDDTLNLSSAFVDLIDLGVSHQFLDGIVTVESISTENLPNKKPIR